MIVVDYFEAGFVGVKVPSFGVDFQNLDCFVVVACFLQTNLRN